MIEKPRWAAIKAGLGEQPLGPGDSVNAWIVGGDGGPFVTSRYFGVSVAHSSAVRDMLDAYNLDVEPVGLAVGHTIQRMPGVTIPDFLSIIPDPGPPLTRMTVMGRPVHTLDTEDVPAARWLSWFTRADAEPVALNRRLVDALDAAGTERWCGPQKPPGPVRAETNAGALVGIIMPVRVVDLSA